MEAYAAVLTYAIPGFVALILIEAIVAKMKGLSVNRSLDTISSLSSGMTNTLKDLLGLSIVIVSYGWMVDNFALFSIASPLWLYLLAFVMIDFASYWSHRFNHVVNVLWNRHIVHHSSEEFNLSCALRQSISGIVGIYFFLFIPLAIIGIPATVIAITAPLHLFAQFWYHTRLINKMGMLEQIIVTPSHHRVHHAINPEYIDKNYAAIFIFWDKLFGTFQQEMPDTPPIYGVKKPVQTWNPILINYQHMWLLIKDSWRTTNWTDKVKIWYGKTGWRPDDVSMKYPIDIIEDVYSQIKYEPNVSNHFKNWSWFQLIINNVLVFYLLSNIANLGGLDITISAVFIFISIFAYTSLMDKDFASIPAEVLKFGFGVFILLQYGGWFQLDEVIAGGTIFITTYLVLSIFLTFYFYYGEFRNVNAKQAIGT